MIWVWGRERDAIGNIPGEIKSKAQVVVYGINRNLIRPEVTSTQVILISS